MWSPSSRREVATALSHAFLAGAWDEAGLLARGVRTFGARPRWLGRVVRETLAAYRARPVDRPRELARFIAVQLERQRRGTPPRIRNTLLFEPEMGPMRWPVPELPSLGDLAAFLDLHLGELEWLADRRGLERRVLDERLRNYRYGWFPRAGAPPRLIERPKRLLKETQRRVLHQILDVVPPHDAAHGFRRGHSVVTHARRHLGQRVVLRFDLEDFFASIEARRVYGIFRAAGYPESVAHALTALCTNVVPQAVWAAAPPVGTTNLHARHRLGARLASPHLPQGAPTSPSLANLCAFRLDARLAGLAQRFEASYSRYADDLALSGGMLLLASAATVRRAVASIVADEGFRLNERKSQLMSRAGRQCLCGVVVNEHPNVSRREFDTLKAILHDAARRGPDAANRLGLPDFRAHLLGRISWVEAVNAKRGAVLRRRFAAIDWSAHGS